MSSNQHIINYLKWYIEEAQNSTQFAVMLKGGWGSGKTYFLKNFVLPLAKDKFIYVSLNGLNHTEQIDDLIFKFLHPILGSEKMALAGKVFGAFTKLGVNASTGSFGVKVDAEPPKIDFKKMITNINEKVLVFDDLERCSIPLSEVIGYINSFVEQDQQKVIIISNEDEIQRHFDDNDSNKKADKTSYLLIKEKLIGKTFEVYSDVKTVIQAVIEKSCKESIDVVINNKEYCFQVFETVEKEKGHRNFRAFSHSLKEFEYFWKQIDAKYKKEEKLITDLMVFFLCLSYEYNLQTITSTDFEGKEDDPSSAFSQHLLIGANSSMQDFLKRHDYANGQWLLSKDNWVQLICENKMPLEAIYRSIEESGYLSKETEWKTLWRYHELPDEEYSRTLDKVIKNLLTGKYIVPEVILHIYGAFISLHEHGEYKLVRKWKNRADMKAAFKKVFSKLEVNDAVKSFLLQNSGHFNTGYSGLAFHSKTETDFIQVYGYAYEKLTESFHKLIFKDRNNIVKSMVSNPEEFYKSTTDINFEGLKLWNVPFFKELSSRTFYRYWNEIEDKTNKNLITGIFRERYSILTSGTPSFTDQVKPLIQEKVFTESLLKLVKDKRKRLKSFKPSHISLTMLEEDLIEGLAYIDKFEKILAKPSP